MTPSLQSHIISCIGSVAPDLPYTAVHPLAAIAGRALAPQCRNYLRLAGAVGIDPGQRSFGDLPALLRETINGMAIGVAQHFKRAQSIARLAGFDGETPSDCDCDVHPGYRFTTVLMTGDETICAVKFRHPGAEQWLAQLLTIFDLTRSVTIPAIRSENPAHFVQEKVARSTSMSMVKSSLFVAMGRFTALAQLVGMNDLHEENLVWCGDQFALIDGETIFQFSHEKWQNADSPHISPLASHLFHRHGYDDIVIGAFARFLAELSSLSGDEHATIAHDIVRGYRDGLNFAQDLAKWLPPRLSIRNVMMPTAAYAALVQKSATDFLHQSSEPLAKHIAERLDELHEDYGPLKDHDALWLARSVIPFHTRDIDLQEMRQFIAHSAAAFDAKLDQNCAALHNAVMDVFQPSDREKAKAF